jgi:hypothetical protein
MDEADGSIFLISLFGRTIAEIGRPRKNIYIGHSQKISHRERQDMLPDDTQIGKEQLRQQPRERFVAGTAEAIGASWNCLFSLLPYEERARQAASWYDACTQGTLRGNYSQLYEWIQHQACTAAEENFKLEDLLELLRICRRSALEVERWNKDLFSAVDEVINEGLLGIRTKVPWNISSDLNYLEESECNPALNWELNPAEPGAPGKISRKERRKYSRGFVALPIRVHGTTQQGQIEEITTTQSISLGGLYFITRRSYGDGSELKVTYPFWTDLGAINREYAARVDRLDHLPEKTWGVAVEFLQNLHIKTA